MPQTTTETEFTDIQAELDKRYTALKNGTDKGLSLAELNHFLNQELRKVGH